MQFRDMQPSKQLLFIDQSLLDDRNQKPSRYISHHYKNQLSLHFRHYLIACSKLPFRMRPYRFPCVIYRMPLLQGFDLGRSV